MSWAGISGSIIVGREKCETHEKKIRQARTENMRARFAQSEFSQAAPIQQQRRAELSARVENRLFSFGNFIAHFLHSTSLRCINLNLNKKTFFFP